MHSTELCDDCKNARMILSENGCHASCTLPLRQAVKCMTGEDNMFVGEEEKTDENQRALVSELRQLLGRF